MRRYKVRIVSTYPPRRCGIGTFSEELTKALRGFPHNIADVKVAAIDNDNLSYPEAVDILIDQRDPASWQQAISEIISRGKRHWQNTVVLLQHEYGLDPVGDGEGTSNYVHMARACSEAGFMVLIYLHSVLRDPDDFQRRTLQELSRYSDAMVVTTENAIGILKSDVYGIYPGKIKHIDHGIRSHQPSDSDRLQMKKNLGLNGVFLVTTLGLRSPDKGVEYGIRGYARFLTESCSAEQRRHIVYLVGGQYHPEFMKAEGGRLYREYEAKVRKTLEETGMAWSVTRELPAPDCHSNDVIFLDRYLDERLLLQIYTATNVMVLPYLNTQQISSGILADTLGSARVAIATKFIYAVELLNPSADGKEGMVIGRGARGILVDPGEDSADQIAQALDYLVFNENRRLQMEERARIRGHQMRWDNTAWQIILYAQLIHDEKALVHGRGIKFVRVKPSSYERRNKRLLPRRERERAARISSRQPTSAAASGVIPPGGPER